MLLAAGVAAILGPGTSRDDIIAQVSSLAASVREQKNAELGEIAQ
jgi:hypothetical protein